jgi:S-adenosylmethionine/arginine decarboxylase-like enzyme
MFDCYGSNPTLLNDVMYVNRLMNGIAAELGLTAIMPPSLIPYYYGKVEEDNGISSFQLLEGGHLTIHTFPLRKCYFLDLYTEEQIDALKLENYLQISLPFSRDMSIVSGRDRHHQLFETHPYDSNLDFGPHVLLTVSTNKDVNLDMIYDFLETLVKEIHMTPIIRPCVLKSTINQPRYLSGMTMIAESHISLHYEQKTKTIMADIFSCVPFDYNDLIPRFAHFGEVLSFEVVARGTKHYQIVQNYPLDNLRNTSGQWKHNIQR